MRLVIRKHADRPHQFTKAKSNRGATLRSLISFLNTAEPQLVEWLVGFWGAQQAAVTYNELREFITVGSISDNLLRQWQLEYAELVNTKLAPQWKQAMITAIDDLRTQFPLLKYPAEAIHEYISLHSAELVTNSANVQIDAIRNMVSYATTYNNSITADELSRLIRPVIGLTLPQSKANLNYFNAVSLRLIKENPNMRHSTVIKRAQEAAAKYAGKQHRYRAMMIARTELAFAYNAGADLSVKDAQARGVIGMLDKVWITADDERTCKFCGSIEGKRVDINSAFDNGILLPPAHPNCRCAVAYSQRD